MQPPSLPPMRLRFVVWFSCWSVWVTGRPPCAPTKTSPGSCRGSTSWSRRPRHRHWWRGSALNPERVQAAAPGHQNGLSPAAGDGNSKVRIAGSGVLDRPPAWVLQTCCASLSSDPAASLPSRHPSPCHPEHADRRRSSPERWSCCSARAGGALSPDPDSRPRPSRAPDRPPARRRPASRCCPSPYRMARWRTGARGWWTWSRST